MPRYDWRDREEDRRRRRDEARDQEDFGQADYSTDYAYDPDTRTGYRAEERLRTREDDYGQADYSSDWGYDADRRRPYRRHSEDDRELRRDDGRYADERRDDRHRDERADRYRDERDHREPQIGRAHV